VTEAPLTVRPIIHTQHVDEWTSILRAMGAVVLSDDPMWTELELGQGRITLTVLNRDAREGEVSMGFETPDLDDFARGMKASTSVRVERFVTEDYTSVRVVCRDGTDFLVDPQLDSGEVSPADDPPAAVRAVWTTPDLASTVEDLAAAGLEVHHHGSGSASLLRAASGEVLVRDGTGYPAEVAVSLTVDDLLRVRARLTAAGRDVAITLDDLGDGLRVSVPGSAAGSVTVVSRE
jgi:hypothetical protein